MCTCVNVRCECVTLYCYYYKKNSVLVSCVLNVHVVLAHKSDKFILYLKICNLMRKKNGTNRKRRSFLLQCHKSNIECLTEESYLFHTYIIILNLINLVVFFFIIDTSKWLRRRVWGNSSLKRNWFCWSLLPLLFATVFAFIRELFHLNLLITWQLFRCGAFQRKKAFLRKLMTNHKFSRQVYLSAPKWWKKYLEEMKKLSLHVIAWYIHMNERDTR